MNADEKRRGKLIILPHWRKGGGSGFYTQNLIDKLKKIYYVSVAGVHSKDFDENPAPSGLLDELSSMSFPVYDGVKKSASLFYAMISLFKALFILINFSKRKVGDAPSVIIFTSSTQAISIPIARYFFPNCKIAIAVQENVNLSSFFGGVLLRFLRKSDVVISITSQWAAHAREFGVDAVVIRNQYDPSYFSDENNSQKPINSDLLYIGGGAKIKGFDAFLKMLPTLLARPELRVLCLGEYQKKELKSLKESIKDSKSSSEMVIIGHVLDIRPYIRGTRLLLLPISSPHFCRPAIEAGFFEKTFVIPAHRGLEDFVQNGVNCISHDYSNGNGSAFASAILDLLDDPAKLRDLGIANRRNSLRFIANDSEFESLADRLDRL
jgi:glycosyltransferase involved in cell wall biosynthesis